MAEERKLVTVLFADIVGSTSLGSENEPEVIRDVMARYFERMKDVAETYGGTVQKFIGDAVMVVFGVPLLHDDDAERAVRCALGMQETLATLNQELGMTLAIRVGVNSGRAVTGGAEGLIVTGDAVNIAARLQQNADPGEVVVGSLTEQLTRQAVEYAARPPILAKGKVEPIKVFTVVRARSAVPRQERGVPTLQAPLVGREVELRLLLDTFDRVREERRAHLFTLVGNAGVGKSRLARETIDRIASRSSVRVLRGRCLPYGKGITYWPLMEILREDVGVSPEDDREAAIGKLEHRVSSLFPAEAQRRAVMNWLTVLLGLDPLTDSPTPVSGTSIDVQLSWAVRQYFQAIAVAEPLVVVVDDLQWAEPALIQVLEQTALRITDHPILLLCIARPELREAHPGWGAGIGNATSINLNPLSAAETEALIARLLEVEELPAALRQRLIERSEGNPLFCEEFLRMLIDEMRVVRVEDRWRAAAKVADFRVPESIHALLAARLDGLSKEEKRFLEAASIVGEYFTARQITAVLRNGDVPGALERLLLKGLVREDSTGPEPGLRFKHLLIRDVAYEAIPKDERAEFHERFERHLDEEVGDRENEFIEILGHHAERAFMLSGEMRLTGPALERRAERALRWSLMRADRARSREDGKGLAASVSVARSAVRARPVDDAIELRLRLLEAESLRLSARFADGLSAAREAASMAARTGDQSAAAAALLCASQIELSMGDYVGFREGNTEAVRLFRLAGDLTRELEAESALVLLRLGDGEGWPAIRDTLHLAERARDAGMPAQAYRWFSLAANFAAPCGFPQQAERCINEATALGDRLGLPLSARLGLSMGYLAWLRSGPQQAEPILLRSITVAEESGESWQAVFVRRALGMLLIDAGRYADAQAVLEQALSDSEESGERWSRAELQARLGLVAIHRGDLAAAEDCVRLALDLRIPNDGSGESESQYALGQLRAAQGRWAEAETAFQRTLVACQQIAYWAPSALMCIGIARFFAERGLTAEATPLLDQAQRWLENAGYSRWLDEIARIRELPTAASKT
jgi:class 3 adenylate cyclase/tetratricopeptide (TPR) repeat protein